MWANQNSSLSFCFSWSLTKPNLSNCIIVPTFSFDSSGSPSPFVFEPSGIVISTLMFSVSAGSHWMNFVWSSLFGSFEMNENVRGFVLRMFSDLKLRRCIRR